ncbi:MAG: HEPN domain-containing protein [Desulfurispora sp.]|uniref:HEPN domain-containing protein n=1 Tax=Desulfurispora sp. TaxID=3014275 RepID=UPI00404A46EE
MEKILKALYFEQVGETPPRKHDLIALARKIGLLELIDEADRDFLRQLTTYYLESRYTEEYSTLMKKCNKQLTWNIIEKTGVMMKWLKEILRQ